MDERTTTAEQGAVERWLDDPRNRVAIGLTFRNVAYRHDELLAFARDIDRQLAAYRSALQAIRDNSTDKQAIFEATEALRDASQ